MTDWISDLMTEWLNLVTEWLKDWTSDWVT